MVPLLWWCSCRCVQMQCVLVSTRLLHSPNLVVIGLSVGYETWPPIRGHAPLVIGWYKYILGLPNVPLRYGLIRMWPVGIPTIFQTPVTVPLHSPNGRQMPAIRAVQGDCERVYVSTDSSSYYIRARLALQAALQLPLGGASWSRYSHKLSTIIVNLEKASFILLIHVKFGYNLYFVYRGSGLQYCWLVGQCEN